jgi:hypothetical protein
MRPSVPDIHITAPDDAELAAYRALSAQAVVGLLFGLLAPLALVDPLLWWIPMLGVLLSALAIRRIKRNDSLTGRKMATAGLVLSLLFGAAAPSDWLLYRRIVRNEARQFSWLWFEFLKQDEPQKAHQLTLAPAVRQMLDHRLWAFYRNDPKLRQALEGYVQAPLVRTLLALGPKAQVRFFDTAGQTRQDDNDVVDELFAVTYEEDGENKSFFVAIQAVRHKLATGEASWRITQAEGGVRPQGW